MNTTHDFSPETQQWEKSGIEGTLFVCQTTGPRYNVVILNRKSLDNFITELKSGEDIEITEQYIILQVLGEGEAPSIFGVLSNRTGKAVLRYDVQSGWRRGQGRDDGKVVE